MTTEKRRRTDRSAEPAKTMADYAMSFDRLGLWIGERAKSATLRHPQATSLSMLDGAVAAVVAGPVSMMPEEWVCPLLGVDPDDFNHDTETFSAIAATLMRHNAIVNTLSTKPESFEPLFVRTPRRRGRRAGLVHGLLRGHQAAAARVVPIDEPERDRARTAAADLVPLRRCFRSPSSRRPPARSGRLRPSLRRRGATFRPSSKPCASSGCRPGSLAVHSRRSKPGRHVYPRTAYVRFGMEVVAGDAQRLRARIAGTNAPSESLRVCSGYWPKRRETFRGLRQS